MICQFNTIYWARAQADIVRRQLETNKLSDEEVTFLRAEKDDFLQQAAELREHLHAIEARVRRIK